MKKLHKAILASLGISALSGISTQAYALDTYIGDLVYNGTTVSIGGSLLPQGWNGTNNGGQGWGHNSQWFRLQVNTTGSLDLRATGTASGVHPAFSVWSTGASGFDTSIGGAHSYTQAGDNPWSEAFGLVTFVGLANNNTGGCGALASCGNSYGVGPGPDGLSGAVATAGLAGGFNYADLFLPNLSAGSWYLIAVGGSGGDAGGYTLSASPAAVPVPAAAWLFGSAVLGMTGFGRRKQRPVVD